MVLELEDHLARNGSVSLSPTHNKEKLVSHFLQLVGLAQELQ